MSTSVLTFLDGLTGFTINARGTAEPDDASLGHFLGLQRAINSYVKRFAMGGRVTVDGKIGKSTVDLLNVVLNNVSVRLGVPRDPVFTVSSAADAAFTLAVRLATMAGVRPDFSTGAAPPAPDQPPPGATPPPDATSEAPPAGGAKGSGAGTVLVAVGAVGIGALLLAALSRRKR
jgi:hypothetical protein